MSDILERLKALGVSKGMPEKPAPIRKRPSDQLAALQTEFPNGFIAENDHGTCFINRLKQPLSLPHGNVDMSGELRQSPLFDSMLGMKVLRKEDTLSFDTETSGLPNGSGSFIFMLGLGYFEGDSYIVDQLILPDLDAEPAFLRQAELIFSRFSVLISYNGKSFDVPMLQSRLNFHLFPDFTKTIAHIDLLNLTRRYWKTSLGSVRLSNIEQYVLRLQRGDEEVPGYLAPELYRDFLRDGTAEHIAGVAYHNQIDVVSLSAFLLYLSEIADRGQTDMEFLKANGLSESALLRHDLPFFHREVLSSLDSFSNDEKRSIAEKLIKGGEREKAGQILEKLAESGDYASAVKLIKLCRSSGDPEKFEHFRTLALDLLEKDETIGKWSKEDKIRKLKALKF